MQCEAPLVQGRSVGKYTDMYSWTAFGLWDRQSLMCLHIQAALHSQKATGAHEAANEIAAIILEFTMRIGRLSHSMRQRSSQEKPAVKKGS